MFKTSTNKEKKVLCLFYNEFNIETGAEIIFQYPKKYNDNKRSYLQQEDYLKISEFVIPRPELCHKSISLKLGDSHLIGYPVLLEHKNYLRTNFQFNFTIIISSSEYKKNYIIYEMLIKKIGKIFENLEIENQNSFLKGNHKLIENFIVTLYEKIERNEEEISIKIADNNLLFFKFYNLDKIKEDVQSHLVPVWIKPIDHQEQKYMDKKVLLVIQNIDGISFVKKIAYKTELDLNFVMHVVHSLLMVDTICLIDIFQFSNIYRATPELIKNQNNLLDEFLEFSLINQSVERDKSIQEICSHFEEKTNEHNCKEAVKLTNTFLFSLYCELCNSESVSDFIKKNRVFNLNVINFISFGVKKKILRRVHIYPYKKKITDDKEKDIQTDNQNKLLSMSDGKNNLDKISCEMNKSSSEIMTFVQKFGGMLLYR